MQSEKRDPCLLQFLTNPFGDNSNERLEKRKVKSFTSDYNCDMEHDSVKPSKQLCAPWFPCVFDDSSSPQDQAVSPSLLPMS
ncbi:hypothetical protein Ahy_A03g012042 isoform C [Arachis hypogaea]|uniref:Uncharacterized protein n=1 Tax=Arachis hypogaea TaxID=3818 RepID=A0A445DSE3_ARAHY|nr:hypothetical protein Ahy_A03g012042 isoform C [Arachis hypogaea]